MIRSAFVRRAASCALVAMACAAGAGCSPSPRHPLSGHSDGERFSNPGHETGKSFGDFLAWQFTRTRGAWPERVENVGRSRLLAEGDADPIAATWIGHASFLVQIGRANVLTDPILSERCSPVSWIGPKRVRPPGLALEELPQVHAVVVSHNHYDHLDLPSLVALDQRFHPKFVVGLGNGALLREAGIADVVEVDWWDRVEVPAVGLAITFAPALHWSARGLGDRFETLWGSFHMRDASGHTVYFAGDTGYADHFVRVRERLGAPDLALLPIGAYAPRWFMEGHHMDPTDAVAAYRDLGARFAVPMHYATFRLADEGFDAPLEALVAARREAGVGETFAPVEVGATFRVPAIAAAPAPAP